MGNTDAAERSLIASRDAAVEMSCGLSEQDRVTTLDLIGDRSSRRDASFPRPPLKGVPPRASGCSRKGDVQMWRSDIGLDSKAPCSDRSVGASIPGAAHEIAVEVARVGLPPACDPRVKRDYVCMRDLHRS
jgi:hypothetical protein